MYSRPSALRGKALARAGGATGLLISSIILVFAYNYLTLAGKLQALLFIVGPSLGVAGGLVPKVSDRVRGGIILLGALIVLAFWGKVMVSNVAYLTDPVAIVASLALVFLWTGMMLVGGIQTFLSQRDPRNRQTNEITPEET